MKQSDADQLRTSRAALFGILCAVAVAVSFLEELLPVIPVPGAKWGLSNIVTMYAISSIGFPAAVSITLVKAGFSLLRGGTAFLMSLSGGLLSTAVMAVVWKWGRRRLSFIGIGVLGAAAHNGGQLLIAVCLLGPSLIYYTPWLLLMAAAAGLLTGITLNCVMPILSRIKRNPS